MGGEGFDLVVRGATVVGETHSAQLDVGVSGGRVAALRPARGSASAAALTGTRVLDATGAFVLPGGVDMHVHLSQPAPSAPGTPVWVDDFESGTAAAIAGGVTTVGNMTFQWPGASLRESVARDLDDARVHALVDYVLHPVLREASAPAVAEIPELASLGHRTLKVFMMSADFDAHADLYVSAIELAGRCGLMTMLHCEDGPLLRYAQQRLLSAGRGSMANWTQSRPHHVEHAATERAIAICEATGAAIYVVHLSSAAALESCRQARRRELPVHVETRPMYLHLTEDALRREDAPKYTGCPPLRTPADREAMWRGLADGSIDCVGTDHAPWRLEAKLDPTLDVAHSRAGVADLETMIPMLYSEGVRAGRLSMECLVAVTSANPARVFGLYPQKGCIAVGSDADLVVLDPEVRRTVDGSTMRSRAGYSVYDGTQVWGWPRYTISRGEVVLDDGELDARAGRGRWLRRGRPTD